MANRVWAHFRPASEPLTPRITRQCSKKKRDRKSTRLNSSHLVISYAVFCFRKSTRLNSSHLVISYAVFCLKKKKRLSSGFLQLLHGATCMCNSDVLRTVHGYILSSSVARPL